MLRFNCEQKTFEISGIKVGGKPLEQPTVLIGSIFYRKHKIVQDEDKGVFDKTRAEKLINLQEEFSDKTGNPCMLDVVGATSDSLIKYLTFTSEVSKCPLLIDGITPQIRIEGLKYIDEVGLSERVIYNSITPDYKQEELEAIKKYKVKNAIILSYYPKDFTSRGRIKIVKELIPKVNIFIDNIMVDTCVLDIPSLGSACKSIYNIKNELGYPSGCGPHNAIETWRGLKTKMGKQARIPSMASVAVLSAAIGADFILYGPIEEAEYIFPSIALVDAAYAQLSIENGVRPNKNHPIFKIS